MSPKHLVCGFLVATAGSHAGVLYRVVDTGAYAYSPCKVNDAGDLAGTYFVPGSGVEHAFIYQDC